MIQGRPLRFVTLFAPNGIYMPDFTPTTTDKLFVSIMNAFGIPDQTFGDKSAQGPIPELMV